MQDSQYYIIIYYVIKITRLITNYYTITILITNYYTITLLITILSL